MISRQVKIGSSVTISPPLFLAPMAGLTHSALRQLILDFGGIGLLSTEMLSASSLPHENPRTSPYLIRTPRERPISYQLLIYSTSQVGPAVEKIQKLGADLIDINLGCGAPKVIKKGGGVALGEDLARLGKIVQEIKGVCHLPVTVKIRLGPEPEPALLKDKCKYLEDLGIDAIYVHARLNKEPFARPPRWELASTAVEAVDIPVIINGGIFSLEDAKKCLEISGAAGLMIGRGAAIRPWIFRDIERDLFGESTTNLEDQQPPMELMDVWLCLYNYLVQLFPPERRLGRLKEFTHYFSQNYAFGNRLAMSVQRSKDMLEALEQALQFFSKNPQKWA